jgi:hypothetical protein
VFSCYLKSYDGISSYDIHLVGADGATGSTITVTPTWTRFSITANGTGGNVLFAIGLRGASSPANSNTADILAWGAQVEQRSAVSSYQPTTYQPITNYQPTLLTASANVARFDHDPVTNESLGLLIEEQRTNLQKYSEDFSNGIWQKALATVTVNQMIAPDGTLTGDKLVEDTTTNIHITNSQPLTFGASTYTASVYAKQAGRQYVAVQIYVNGTSSRYTVLVDLSDGSFVASNNVGSPTNTSYSIISVGNGWYRISVTATQTSTSLAGIGVGASNSATPSYSSGLPVYTGDGYSGIYIWGAQLEAGAFPTSYIKTEASQVTRSADSASMTGANFSSWYRADEGSVYVESEGAGGGANFSIGISAERLVSYASTSTTWFIIANGSTQVNLSIGQYIKNEYSKIAGVYKTNDFAASLNSGNVGVDASGLLPLGSNKLTIGSDYFPNAFLNGHIKKISYFPARLSNEELQEMTS